MANSPILVELPSGLDNITVKLFAISTALGDANPINDSQYDNTSGPDSVVEYSNRVGLYATYVDESLTGWFYALFEDTDDYSTVASGWVYLTDTSNYHYVQFDVPTSDSAPSSSTGTASSGQYYNIVSRGSADNNPVHFEWPETGRTVTARVSFNGGPYASVTGNVSEVRAEGTSFLYQLSYAQADRATVGVAEYELTDGITTRYLPLATDSGGSNGGEGLFQLTVTVRDVSNNALQGARINVDGTTLTQTSNSLGQCVFNLDSGVYLLECSPPAGYDTPLGNVVTITSSDTLSIFSLTPTSDDDTTCVPWI